MYLGQNEIKSRGALRSAKLLIRPRAVCRKEFQSGELSDGSAQAENRLVDHGYASASWQHETVTIAMCDSFARARSGRDDDALGGTGNQQI